MKLLCTGDWHITAHPPRKRKDDYVQTQKRKIKFIIQTAKEHGCACILQPGDFYDHHTEPYWIIRKYIRLFSSHLGEEGQPHIYTLFGQHDQRYHTIEINNTPLGLTETSPYVHLLKQEYTDICGCHIYGADWSQPIPEIVDESKTNILVIHKMIVKDKLWEQQEEYEHGAHVLRKEKFDLVVSGDNHAFFTNKVGNRHLINCGSLMRSTSNQSDHKPVVFVVEIINKDISITPIEIPIHSFDSVFDVELEDEKVAKKDIKQQTDKLNQFISALRDKSDMNEVSTLADLDFYKNLMDHIEKENVDSVTKSIIQSSIPT